MVTTLYRGLAGKTLGSKLEALGLSTDFAGGVLIARAMEGGIRFGLGATIATTKTVLGEIGGLEPLVDYLGDDYELGARAAAAGYKVELAALSRKRLCPIIPSVTSGRTRCAGRATSKIAVQLSTWA